MALRLISSATFRGLLRPNAIAVTAKYPMSVYKGGVPTKDEGATGKERVQLEAWKAGVDDPYDREAHYIADYPEGTGLSKDNPIPVPSSLDRRMIGCTCTMSEHFVNYCWLYAGEPKRCGCGIWFELVYRKPPHEIWVPEETKLPKDESLPKIDAI